MILLINTYSNNLAFGARRANGNTTGLEAELKRLMESGEKASQTALAKEFDVSRYIVTRLAKKIGCPTQSISEAKLKKNADIDGLTAELKRIKAAGEKANQTALAMQFRVSQGKVKTIAKAINCPTQSRAEANLREDAEIEGLKAELERIKAAGEKANSTELAKKFGVSDGAVARHAKRIGCKTQNRSEANLKQGADIDGLKTALKRIKAAGRKATIVALANKFKVAKGTVKKYATTIGCPTKSRSEANLKNTASIQLTPVFQFSTGRLVPQQVTQFNWQVSINDTTYTKQQLEALLVKNTTKLKRADIKKALKSLNAQPSPLSTLETAQLAEGILPARLKGNLPKGVVLNNQQSSVELPAEAQALRPILKKDRPYQTLAQPQGFSTQYPLKPFQLEGLSWMQHLTSHGLGVCLADDMGLGKTAQTLALIQHKKNTAQTSNNPPSLIVVPQGLLKGWQEAQQKFTPNLKLTTYYGQNRTIPQDTDIVLTTYETLTSDIANGKTLTSKQWNGVVLDEAQKVKTLGNAVNLAANALQGKSKYRVALTGTPMENHVGELYSTLDFLNPGLLGKVDVYKKEFFKPIHARGGLVDGQYKEPEVAKTTRQQLSKLVEPFILRRTKTDITVRQQSQSKPYQVHYHTHNLKMGPEQTAQYEVIISELKKVKELPLSQRRGKYISGITQLLQVANDPRVMNPQSTEESEKMALTKMILDEAVNEKKEKALVFTRFTKQAKRIVDDLEKTYPGQVMLYHGKLSKQEKDSVLARFRLLPLARRKMAEGQTLSIEEKALIERYKNEPEPLIMVLTTKAGNAGLNLQEANHVIHFDRWWNPAVENQATARADRMGQTKDVHVHTLQTQGTIEERIQQIIDDKAGVIAEVIPSGKKATDKLSTKALEQLLLHD